MTIIDDTLILSLFNAVVPAGVTMAIMFNLAYFILHTFMSLAFYHNREKVL